MDLIDRVKEFVLDLGISEREFASVVGVGQRSVNYYFKGKVEWLFISLGVLLIPCNYMWFLLWPNMITKISAAVAFFLSIMFSTTGFLRLLYKEIQAIKGEKKGMWYSDEFLMDDIIKELNKNTKEKYKFIEVATGENHYPFQGDKFEKYNMSILYTGEKDTDTTVKNPWYVLHVKENEQNGIFASTLSDPQKTSQIVGRIKFKVKQNIEETPAEILIKDMEAFDADAISSGATSGDKVTDASVILTVNGTSGNGQQNNNGQTNNNQSNNTESGDTKNQIKNTQVKNIENRNKNDNRANNDVPYTGIEDTIPVIFILAVIALLAYINYRRYKNI